MSVHGNNDIEIGVRVGRGDEYPRDVDMDDDLAWMEPIYQKFDELQATVNEQRVAQSKEAERAEIHCVLVEDKLSDVCVR
jgi:hypothetical protein